MPKFNELKTIQLTAMKMHKNRTYKQANSYRTSKEKNFLKYERIIDIDVRKRDYLL